MSDTRPPETRRHLTAAWELLSREGIRENLRDWSHTETAVVGFRNHWTGRILRVWADGYLLWERGEPVTDISLAVSAREGRPVIECVDFPLSRFGGRWPEFAAEVRIPAHGDAEEEENG